MNLRGSRDAVAPFPFLSEAGRPHRVAERWEAPGGQMSLDLSDASKEGKKKNGGGPHLKITAENTCDCSSWLAHTLALNVDECILIYA